MKTRNLMLSVSLIALTVSGTGAASPSTSKAVAPDSKLVAPSPAGPESALKQAMPADVVRKIMGPPKEIKPMRSPDGKTEIWIYQREVDTRVDRVPVGSVPITISAIGSDGQAHQQTIGENVQYADLYQATEETVQLLMFNDHFVTQKTTRRQIKRYN